MDPVQHSRGNWLHDSVRRHTPHRVRSGGGPRQVRGGARQAHDRGPRGPPRPDAPTSGSPSTREDPFTPVRRARAGRRRRRRRDHRRRHRRASSPGAKLREAGLERDPLDRQGRRHRRHLVLEPLPGRDVRRRVVHLHADARGDGLRPDDALRVRRGDPPAPRGDRRPVRPRSTTRCSTPASRRSEWDDERVALGDPHRPGRRDPGPVPDHGGRDPQPHEAAGDPGHGRLRGHGVPHRPLGLRLHRRWPGRPAPHQARPTRSSASSAPARAASRRVPAARRSRRSTCTCSSARRRPSACAATARPTPTFAERARSPGWQQAADGELPGGHDRPAGRRATSSTTAGRHHYARGQQPAVAEGHDASRSTSRRGRGVRLRDHGGAPAADRGARRRSRRRRDAQAVLPVPAASGRASTTSTSPRSTTRTSPSSTARPASSAITEHGAGRRRHGVRGRLHRLRHRLRGRAHAVRRAAPATTIVGRGGITHGREVGRRRRQPASA